MPTEFIPATPLYVWRDDNEPYQVTFYDGDNGNVPFYLLPGDDFVLDAFRGDQKIFSRSRANGDFVDIVSSGNVVGLNLTLDDDTTRLIDIGTGIEYRGRLIRGEMKKTLIWGRFDARGKF